MTVKRRKKISLFLILTLVIAFVNFDIKEAETATAAYCTGTVANRNVWQDGNYSGCCACGGTYIQDSAGMKRDMLLGSSYCGKGYIDVKNDDRTTSRYRCYNCGVCGKNSRLLCTFDEEGNILSQTDDSAGPGAVPWYMCKT